HHVLLLSRSTHPTTGFYPFSDRPGAEVCRTTLRAWPNHALPPTIVADDRRPRGPDVHRGRGLRLRVAAGSPFGAKADARAPRRAGPPRPGVLLLGPGGARCAL